MGWKKTTLGEIAKCIQPGPFGSQLHSSDYSDYGVPIIMPKDMIEGKISHTNMCYVSEEHQIRLSRHQVFDGDLLVARKGDVRKCVYITENENGCLTGSDCLKVSLNKEKCHPKYIYYQLRSAYIGRWLEKISIGATMPSLNSGLLGSIELYIPPIEVQKEIADILSAYDDLIENNQKQIKLLEEAAQRLYKEWFVDLRFPGHENLKIVDGVPEGWEESTVGKYLNVRSGYAFKSSWWQKTGYPVVKIKDIVNNTVDISCLDYVAPEYASKAREFILMKGDIVIAMTGATIGKIGIVPEVNNLYTNQRVGKIFPCDRLQKPTAFIFCYYSQKKILDEIMALSSSSSAQPNISGGQLESFKIVANIDTINKFCRVTQPFFDQINILYKKNSHLIQARNRLLPKLISGEIEL